MAWSDFGTAVAELTRDLIKVFAPDADEKEKRLKISAREAFKKFIVRSNKAADERKKLNQGDPLD